MTITAAADGSALGNPGPAGWAWYVDDDRWAAGGWPESTNNRGELQAVLELLRATAHVDEDLHVLCDSKYVINSVTKWMPGWKRKGWKKADGKEVLNKDLMIALDEALRGRQVRFEWVKGHSNHRMNEAADTRANGAARSFQNGTPLKAGPGFPGAGENPAPTTTPDDGPKAARAAHPGDASAALFELDMDIPAEEAHPSQDSPAGSADTVRVWADVPADLAAGLAARARATGRTPQDELRAVLETALTAHQNPAHATAAHATARMNQE